MRTRPPHPLATVAVTNQGEVARFFDENVEDYARKHYAVGSRTFMSVRQWRMLQLIDRLNLPAGTTALDAGCGPGYLLAALARRGFTVSGLDMAPEMLRMTSQRLADLQLAADQLQEGSIEALPFPSESFDLVCTAGVVEYLRTDERVLAELHRVLKPGGWLLYPVTNALSPVDCFDFIVEFLKRRRWFLRLFNAFWQRLGRAPVLPRHFHVRRHRPGALRASLARAGFTLQDDLYFFFLPFPRPLDKLLPGIAASAGARLERLGRTRLGPLAEGYLTLSRRALPGS